MLRKVLPTCLFAICIQISAAAIPTVYIAPNSQNGAPAMPNIGFNLSEFDSRSGYIIQSVSENKRRGNADNIKLSFPYRTGYYNVNAQVGNRIFGGEISLKAANDGRVLSNIKVRGKNPDDTDAYKFIKSNCGVHWYAYAIARHESRQRYYVFNQFNSAYYKESIRGTPNCGLPDGWGIMQIDSKRGSKITTEEVYDWQKNIKSGIAVMDKARKEATAYFEAVKRTYPDKWENPPNHITLGGTKTRLSYLDACVIQLYNGASVVRRLKTAYGTYSYYRSAFVFDEEADEGQRWKFKPNVNSYVFKVVNHEIEGGIKIENER